MSLCPTLKLLSNIWWILISKKNQNKQQYFTDNHYKKKLLWNSLKSLVVVKKVKQVNASFGPKRISWFINITEFSSPRTLLESK